MAKSLRDISPKGVKKSKTEPMDISDLNAASGNQDFAKKHKIEKHEDRVGNGDEVYKGKTKQTDMTKHGYKAPADEKVYESSIKCESCGKSYEGESCGCGDKSVPKAGVGKRGLLTDKKKLNEVLTKKTTAGEVIGDFVHSKNKMFKGDSKKQRIKRALGAYYDKHPEKSKNEEVEYVTEGGMPASVIKSKQNRANMTDKEFADVHQDKSDADLRSMAWRHGYGKPGTPGHDHYVNRRAKGLKEDLAMPMLEGGKKKKTQKESAPGDTPMRFPSGDVGDTGRV